MANMSVSSFMANFQGGGARPNLYEVILTFPQAVPDANFAQVKTAFTCKAASLPSSNMGIAEVPYMGRAVKLAGDKVFDDWNITIVNDLDFASRNAFERWLNFINEHESNLGVDPPMLYLADAVVNQLDRSGGIIKSYQMERIFPTQVGEITLGYDQNDQVEEYSVTFAVNWWSTIGTVITTS